MIIRRISFIHQNTEKFELRGWRRVWGWRRASGWRRFWGWRRVWGCQRVALEVIVSVNHAFAVKEHIKQRQARMAAERPPQEKCRMGHDKTWAVGRDSWCILISNPLSNLLFGEERVTTLESREESVTTLLMYSHQTCKAQVLSGMVIGVTGQERFLRASPPRLAGWLIVSR